jgi:hypothetical protein
MKMRPKRPGNELFAVFLLLLVFYCTNGADAKDDTGMAAAAAGLSVSL